MTHYHGHRKRLRERLRETPEKAADYEVLELLLGYVLLRCDTKPLAKELLSRFGSLRAVLQAQAEDLSAVPGIGPGVVDFFLLLREFIARHAVSLARERAELDLPHKVALMARERLGHLVHEEIWAAFLNNRLKLMAWEKLASGSAAEAHLSPRAIIERALLLKASGLIIVHNHPGGDPNPSASDLDFTERLQKAAQVLLIHVHDHIIVCGDRFYSFARDSIL